MCKYCEALQENMEEIILAKKWLLLSYYKV